ncbi:hypothetical protein AN161_26595 [Lysinibacillus sp. FJAT-14222]|nr:hypothetical protein AN161_26595 [Lysinibacillus sp. FJAT-14222]
MLNEYLREMCSKKADSNQLLFFSFFPVSIPAAKTADTIQKKYKICWNLSAVQYPKKFINTSMTNKIEETMSE